MKFHTVAALLGAVLGEYSYSSLISKMESQKYRFTEYCNRWSRDGCDDSCCEFFCVKQTITKTKTEADPGAETVFTFCRKDGYDWILNAEICGNTIALTDGSVVFGECASTKLMASAAAVVAAMMTQM